MLHGAELLLSPPPLDDWEETSKLFWHFPWIAQEFVLGNFNEVSLRFEEYVFYTKGTTPRAPPVHGHYKIIEKEIRLFEEQRGRGYVLCPPNV